MNRTHLSGAAIAVIAALSLGACNKADTTKAAADAAKPAADVSKAADAVKADATQLVADFNAHDPVKTASHDAPDTVAMMHGQPNTVGKDADQAGLEKYLPTSDAKLTVSDETVDVANSGDMAVYHAKYSMTATDAKTKKTTTETGNWIVGYKTQSDGVWKVVWSVVSDAPLAAAPAAAPAAKAADESPKE